MLFIAVLAIVVKPYAQPQVPHASPEARQKARDRADYNTFKRKIVETKEFGEEKKKIPLIKKGGKDIVKVYATVDSVETSEDTTQNKFITGYITQAVGDNVANIYELKFDRTSKKIVNIKKTGEGIEPESDEPKAKPAAKKPAGTPQTAAPKKKKSEDDEEEGDEPEEKEEKQDKKEKDE